MTIKEEIGDRLAKFAKKNKWKKYQLADMAGVQASHIKKYISAEFDPIKIIEALYKKKIISNWEVNFLLIGGGLTSAPIDDDNIAKEPRVEYNANMIDELKSEIKDLKAKLYDKDQEIEKLKKELSKTGGDGINIGNTQILG